MLGTTIITAALATGDTMSHTIRSSATAALGRHDEIIGAKGIDAALASRRRRPTGARYFPQATPTGSRAARRGVRARRRRSRP